MEVRNRSLDRCTWIIAAKKHTRTEKISCEGQSTFDCFSISMVLTVLISVSRSTSKATVYAEGMETKKNIGCEIISKSRMKHKQPTTILSRSCLHCRQGSESKDVEGRLPSLNSANILVVFLTADRRFPDYNCFIKRN